MPVGYSLDPATGYPTFTNDASDPVGQFQANAEYTRRTSQLTFSTFAELDAYAYSSVGLSALVTGEGTIYSYLSDALGWVPTGGKLPYVQDTRSANMPVGSGTDHNVMTITLPRAGRWQVEAHATFEANAAGTRRSLLKVDGVTVATRGVAPSSVSGAGMDISDIVTVTRGGVPLAFNVYQTSGAIIPLLADAGLWKIALRAQYLSVV